MFNKIKEFFKTKATLLPENLQNFFSNGFLMGGGFADSKGTAFDDYKYSLYMHVAVSMIAFDFSNIELYLNRVLAKSGDYEEIFESPYLDVLNKPNSILSGRELMQVSAMHYLLMGEVYWHKEYEGSTIKNLWVLNPLNITKRYNNDKTELLGYNYADGRGATIQYDLEEIAYAKNPNPANIVDGISSYNAVRNRIYAEKEASSSQAKSFKDNGKPDIIVFTKSKIGRENAREALDVWNQAYAQKQNKIAVVGGDIEKVEQTNLTPKEMDYTNSMSSLARDIFLAFRIPEGMFFSKDVNRSNSETAYRTYQNNAILPLVKTFEDLLNTQVITIESDEVFMFDDFIKDDREMLLQEATQLKVNQIITQNEARALYGYGAVEGGDEFRTPLQEMHFRKLAKYWVRKKKFLHKRLDIEDKYIKLMNKTHELFPDEVSKQAFIKALNNVEEKEYEKFLKELKKFFSDQRDRILVQNPDEFDTIAFMDISLEDLLGKQQFKPFMTMMYERNGNAILEGITGERFFTMPELMNLLMQRVDFFVETMNHTTYSQLNKIISEGVLDGRGTKAIARDITEKFSDIKINRARTIARTETNWVLNKSHYDAYNQSSLIDGYEWITAGDHRVRDEHRLNDGSVAGKYGTFPNGEAFPGQNSINCRCRLVGRVRNVI